MLGEPLNTHLTVYSNQVLLHSHLLRSLWNPCLWMLLDSLNFHHKHKYGIAEAFYAILHAQDYT